jgi:serine/threonine-protein kinase
LGPRSDVYGLGATLYCLLTGQPPFEGEDAGAVLGAVREGDFARPTRLDPSMDPALEAVCLRAMAFRPEDRYASPRVLAEDVERWMADEPVSAWKEPRARRLWRWLLAHRMGITGAAAAALVGVLGLCTVLAVQASANARLSASLEREKDAKAELALAYANLETSRAAVQTRYGLAADAIRMLHTVVTEDLLLREGRFKGLRDRLLRAAADFYGKLSALLSKETDLASRRALARSNFELAELAAKIGPKEAALRAQRAVLAAREALAAEPGADAGVKVDVGQSLAAVAWLLDEMGQLGEAEVVCRRSEALLADLVGSYPSARAPLAASRSLLGRLMLGGRDAEALSVLRQARADLEVLSAAPDASSAQRRDLALTVYRIGMLLLDAGNLSEAEAEFRKTNAIPEGPADGSPAFTDLLDQKSAGHLGLSELRRRMGSPAEAVAESLAALAILQKVAHENPAVTRSLQNLTRVLNHHIWLLASIGRSSEAVPECRKWLAACRKLADDNPSVTELRTNAANCHNILGLFLFRAGRPSEAEAECRTALEFQQKLCDDHPDDVLIRRHLAYVLNTLGDVVRSRGRVAEAGELYEREIGLREPLIRKNPTDRVQRYWMAVAIRRRGLAKGGLGNPSGAAADLRRALGLCNGLPPRSDDELFETACCHAALVALTGRAGSGVSAAEGRAAADRAMEWLRRAVATGYRNADVFRIEEALDPLRGRDDFRLLMMDLAMPAEPFAPGD